MQERELVRFLKHTPSIDKYLKKHMSEDPQFFRQIGVSGIITFAEYLFLLSVMTKPKADFRLAFDIMDMSEEDTIMKAEFSKFCLIASYSKKHGRALPLLNPTTETTLQRHFFGRRGDHNLTFHEFSAFVRALQREVLRAEFVEYSRGLNKITEEDFARMLFTYTDLSEENQQYYFSLLDARLPGDLSSRPGLTFAEVEQFFCLLNNLGDFRLAFLLYPRAGHSLNREEFARAAKISMKGEELSKNVIEVIFALFDTEGDNGLSYEEFFVVVRNRLGRRVRRSLRRKGYKAFKRCVNDELHSPFQR